MSLERLVNTKFYEAA